MTEQARTKPNWIRDTGLVSATLPDSPFTQKYRGAQRIDSDEQYAQALSDAALDSLVRAGVTLVWVNFFNGFGIEFEKAELERLRDFIARAHARGLKIAAVIETGALVPETLLLEENEAQNWLQVNSDGRHPAISNHGGFALSRPCYNSESFMRYMERVCSLALDFGADAVHFRHVGFNAEPDTCRCPICISAFREFLKAQYGAHDERTRAAGKERFGHNHFTHARPPSVEAGSGAQNSPHMQEWTRFKVQTLTYCLSRLARGISKRNPECAVGADLLRGADANTDAFGINYSEQLTQLDLVSFAAHCGSSRIPERARSMREARVCGATLEGGSSGDLETKIALNLALNERGLGSLGSVLSAALSPGWESRIESDCALKALRGCIEFYQKHKGMLLGARSLTSIGVYRDTPTRAYRGEAGLPWSKIESALNETDVAFDPVFAHQAGNLSSYRCIILPECECLNDELAGAFERYVNAGGALVVLGDAGSRDPWRRRRSAAALAALIGGEFPNATQRNIGDGRVSYIPAPCDAAKTAELISSLSFARPWMVGADGGAIVSQGVQTRGGVLAVHVVNAGDEAAKNVRVSVACDAPPQQVLPLSFDHNHEPLAFTYDNGRVNFSFDLLRKYVLFQISN